MSKDVKYWKIDVASWGVLWARGTEEQAEAWRKHKARWEQSVATKIEVEKSALPEHAEWDDLEGLLP